MLPLFHYFKRKELLCVLQKAFVNTIPYRRVCALNFERTARLHARMICYWNERYRYECYRYRDYIGKRLFAECFGYRKTGQKKIELYERKQQK